MKNSDPFAIKTRGGDISDRNVRGFSYRLFEGSTLGEVGLASLRRVISERWPSIFAIILGILILGGLSRLIYLQVSQGGYLRSVAEGNRIRTQFIPAPRGVIYDRRGKILASTVPGFRLTVVPASLPKQANEREALLNDLLKDVPTELLETDNLQNLKSSNYLPQILAYNLPRELALQIATRINNLSGLNIEVVGVRSYIDNSAFGHLLGYVAQISEDQYKNNSGRYNLNDLIGKTGLEKTYDDVLRGVTGKREVEVAPSGTELKIYTENKAIPGQDFYLSVDADLQELAFTALARAAAPRGISGSVVVTEVQSGQILALTSYPSFNPNVFTIKRDNKIIKNLLSNSSRPLFNRVLQATYPPGSTIKPIIAAGALQENVITPSTTFLSTGGVQLGNRFFADWKPGGHGRVNVIQAIAESVNTFFYLTGGGNNEREGLGVNRITSYLKQFKFNEAPQIDLPQVEAGVVPSPEWKQKTLNDRWFLGDTYNISIGQGNLLVTPLELLKSYVALLNNGKLINFKISDDKKNNLSATDDKNYPTVNLRPEVFEVVRQGMRQTVVSGSARSLNTLPIAVAGKTGTAQAGTGKMPHAWFAGYAPYDKPEIALVVMLENGGEGSSVAVPIAREIFSWYAANQSSFLDKK